MLILFDLDDTLIETSKCISPFYLRLAFEAMVQAGLQIEESEKAFEELKQINEKEVLSQKDAIKEFCQRYTNQQKILIEGLAPLSHPLPEHLKIDPVSGAFEVLDSLGKECDLAIVTRGNFDIQIQKMKKAGIQPKQFSKIVVGQGESKKFDYQTVLKDLNTKPQECIACGDRIPIDLTPAKELGIFTVHFRNGRGLFHSSPKEHVDVTIDSLKELQEVFVNYEG